MDETNQPIKYNVGTDITFKLVPRDGEGKNTIGLIDRRLFTGENKLHGIVDKQTMLWYLKYDQGILPQQLQQRFTGIRPMVKMLTDYFNKRNIDVIEQINDKHG